MPIFAFTDNGDGYYQVEAVDVNSLPHWTKNLTPCAVIQRPTGEVVDEMWGLIKAERDRRKGGGFLAAGKWFHSDPDSKLQHLGNKDTARDQLAAGGSLADPLLDPDTGRQIVWKTMDGSWLPLTCQLAFDVVRAGKAAEFAHHAAAEMHKAAMLVSAEPSAYAFSAGWPAIFGD